MTRRHGIAAGRIGLMVAAGWVGNPIIAQAATPLYWPGAEYGSDRAIYDSDQPVRRRVARQPRMPKAEAARADKLAQTFGKPNGPLVVAIAIESQTMKVYDANGLFAETPISSGMKGHSTPMGVFSVIQKNKYHRSNIYSGAPMPYMQRITWSGVAMHAGALPGYPASHGCIRMPMAFASRMWGWTRMGARVVITPGEISPASFTHPLLASIKSTPAGPATPMAAPVLRPSIKSTDALPVANTKTADAGNTIIGATVSDASRDAASDAETRAKEALPADAPVVVAALAAEKPVAAEASVAASASSEKPMTAEKPATTDLPAATDQSAEKPAEKSAAPDAASSAKRNGGPIAIFVSRKDSRLYVRQNFAPLFDVPVTISGDQPLGTHVFTAFPDKDASKPVQWTALTLPAPARTDDPVLSRRRQTAGAVVTTPPLVEVSAAEALSRLTLPEDLLSRLGDQLSAGSSLILSDQGILASGETGKGTDFIIRYR